MEPYLKPLGYVLPPFPIVDFAPIYYGSDENPYVAEITDHHITGFYPISTKTRRLQIAYLSQQEARKIGDTAIYCYLPALPQEEVIGTLNEIASRLYRFLTSERMSDFAKLSLAYFFQMPGYQKILITHINVEYQKNDPDFRLSEIELPAEELNDASPVEKIYRINNLVRTWEFVMATHIKALTWLHVIYIDESGVLFSHYLLSVEKFAREVRDGRRILRQYLTFLHRRDRYPLLLRNAGLYLQFLNDSIPDPISIAEEAEMLGELTISATVEEQIRRELSDSPFATVHDSVDTPADPAAIERFKNFKYSFTSKLQPA